MATAPIFNDNLEDLLNKVATSTAHHVLLAAADGLVPPRKFLTNTQAAVRLGPIEPDTLSLWRSKGLGPPWVGSGKMVRYAVTAIDDYIAALPRAEK
jgi:hypothetical protein